MTDVAKRAGVSQTTVSFVVNNRDAGLPEHTKRKVLQACAELKYSPNEAARRLASKTTRAIGLAIYDISAAANYRQSIAMVIASVYRAAEARQQRLHIYTTDERREGGADISTYFAVPIRSREVDGIVLLDAYVDDACIIAAFEEGLPMVMLDRRCGRVPAVVPDYEYGFRRVAETLVEKEKHNRICLATGKGNYYRDSRVRGAFLSAAIDVGIPTEAVATLEVDIETETDRVTMSDLIDKMLAEGPRPTAMVCAYDVIALAATAALRQKGIRVPDDVAVVGCSGVLASGDPAYDLTTLDIRHEAMGQHAVDLVIRAVKGENVAGSCIVVQPELILRSTL